MLLRVEATLARGSIDCAVGVELILQLLTIEECFKEFFVAEPGFLLLFRHVRQSISIPEFCKALRPGGRIEHGEKFVARYIAS